MKKAKDLEQALMMVHERLEELIIEHNRLTHAFNELVEDYKQFKEEVAGPRPTMH